MELTARQLSAAAEDAPQRQAACPLVEVRVVGPGSAVDVEGHEVPVGVAEPLDPLELSRTCVDGAFEGHRLHVTAVEREVPRPVGVVEEAGDDEEALLVGCQVRAVEAGEAVFLSLGPLVERRPPEHAPAALLELEEDDVADRVFLGDDDAATVARPRDGQRHPAVLPQRLRGVVLEVDPHHAAEGLAEHLHREVRGQRAVVDVDQVSARVGERGLGDRFGEASGEGNRMRPILLVPVGVDHHHDPIELGDGDECLSVEQLRVLERDPRRQQLLGHRSPVAHRVQGEVTAEVGDEGDPVADQLRLEKEPPREEGLDAGHAHGAGP